MQWCPAGSDRSGGTEVTETTDVHLEIAMRIKLQSAIFQPLIPQPRTSSQAPVQGIGVRRLDPLLCGRRRCAATVAVIVSRLLLTDRSTATVAVIMVSRLPCSSAVAVAPHDQHHYRAGQQ